MIVSDIFNRLAAIKMRTDYHTAVQKLLFCKGSLQQYCKMPHKSQNTALVTCSHFS